MKSNCLSSAPALAAAVLGLSASTGAQAQTPPASTLTANAALVSDYRFRGVSQTFRKPALQAGADYVAGAGWYVGTWASTIDNNLYASSAGVEWDLYGGYKMPLGSGWTLDVGLLQYVYPGAGSFNTLEAYVGASWDWFSVKYSHSLSSKFFGVADARGSGYIDLTAIYPLRTGFNVIGHVGYQRVAGGGNDADYSDYRLGLTYDWKGFTWGASVYGTSEDFTFVKGSKSKDLGGPGLVVSVAKTFSLF